MRSIYTIADMTTQVISKEHPQGMRAKNGLEESELCVEYKTMRSSARAVLLDGAKVVYRESCITEEFRMGVEHDFPFLKMQFEIEGHSAFHSTVRGVPDVVIPGGHHRFFFLPEVKGFLTYPCSRSTVEINLTEEFLSRILQNDLRAMGAFGAALGQREPALLGTRPMPILPEMRYILFEMKNCNYQGILKKIYLETKITELLLMQIRQTGESGQRDVRMKKADIEKLHFVKEYIARNIHDPKSIVELSRLSGMNDCKLKSGFKAVFGCTIFEYLTSVRLDRARHLLEDGDQTIAEIAYLVGYRHSQHFAAAFRRKFGCSPSQVRPNS